MDDELFAIYKILWAAYHKLPNTPVLPNAPLNIELTHQQLYVLMHTLTNKNGE